MGRALLSSTYSTAGLTPVELAARLDMWDRGNLPPFAQTARAIERRDAVVASAASRRKKSVSRLDWKILTVDLSPEALRQKAALEFFFRNLKVSDAVDPQSRGGVRLLVYQMMDAVGLGYAAHEILWQPKGEGKLSAELRFFPLHLFEATTGALRIRLDDTAANGTPLPPDEWMVSRGDGLMVATSIAYLFKHMNLKDWITYCERFGTPGVLGRTSARKGSPEWESMVEAVRDISGGLAAVISSGSSIEALSLGVNWGVPYPQIVERMDRCITALWRGSDLEMAARSTEESGGVQGRESYILEQGDAECLSETIQTNLARPALRFLFGDSAMPLAYFQIVSSMASETQVDLMIDQFLLGHGVKLGLAETMQRYRRPLPRPGEATLKPVSNLRIAAVPIDGNLP